MITRHGSVVGVNPWEPTKAPPPPSLHILIISSFLRCCMKFLLKICAGKKRNRKLDEITLWQKFSFRFIFSVALRDGVRRGHSRAQSSQRCFYSNSYPIFIRHDESVICLILFTLMQSGIVLGIWRHPRTAQFRIETICSSPRSLARY